MASLALISLLALSLPLVTPCNRYKYYGEPCMGVKGYGPGGGSGGGSDQCDTSRALKCDIRTGTCQCPDFWYYFYDTYNSRCYHKIGTACQERFGGLDESWYNHGCPENSFCNPGSGYCACKPLYKSNQDGTGCFSLNRGTGHSMTLRSLVTLTLLVNYFK